MTTALTDEESQALENGEAVPVTVGKTRCVLVRQDVYEKAIGEPCDAGSWTKEEIDLLASEAADLLAGDAFDYPDDDS